MSEPLFKTEGSVYRRPPSPIVKEEELDDEDWVDRSIPSTPLDDRYPDDLFPSGPSQSQRAGSNTPTSPMTGVKHEPEVGPEVKEEHVGDDNRGEAGRERDDDTPLREIDPDETDVDEPEPEDERQCRICFSGKEEEAALGRLISPCLCTGSVRVSLVLS